MPSLVAAMLPPAPGCWGRWPTRPPCSHVNGQQAQALNQRAFASSGWTGYTHSLRSVSGQLTQQLACLLAMVRALAFY